MRTVICDLLGIEYPVIQGGMAWLGTAELASAGSNGGGLGIIGAGNAPPAGCGNRFVPPGNGRTGPSPSTSCSWPLSWRRLSRSSWRGGLIREIKPDAAIIKEIVEQAESIIAKLNSSYVGVLRG